MKTNCAECGEEFSFLAEPKGVLVVVCPFCSAELKIEFEDTNEKEIYRSVKV